MTFGEYLSQVSGLIDEELLHILGEGSRLPTRLAEAMAYTLHSGGKRLRPAMTMFSNNMFVESRAALKAACAVELVHTYSLVHDDLPGMDNDDYRRGRPSCHRAYDEATAILVGDALLTMAFEALASLPDLGVTADTALRAISELANAAGWRGMVLGQAQDLTLAKDAPVHEIQQMHELKTGKMFTVSLRLGAIIGGAPEEDVCALSRFGYHFGRVYQAMDDLQDAGKDSSDIERASLYDSLGQEGVRQHVLREVVLGHTALSRFGKKAWWLHDLIDFVG